jgi:hypothetical protein
MWAQCPIRSRPDYREEIGLMKSILSSYRVRWILTALLLATVFSAHAQAQSKQPAARTPWRIEDVKKQLGKYPKDVFLQYVALKLGQRGGYDVSDLPGLRERTRRQMSGERRESVDLFNLFSGSLAVQESLQLDAMRPASDFNGTDANPGDGFGTAPRQENANRPKTTPKVQQSVSVASLKGPTVQSHPWHEMRKGQTPKYSVLANYVPADNYYIRFKSVSRMLGIMDDGYLFAQHLFSQTGTNAIVRDTQSRIRQQLAIAINPLARPFYDLVVKEIAITGSDPFVNEGSDVTLLFRYEQDVVFTTQMNAYLATAQKSVADVTRAEETWGGIPFVHLTSPNRDVHVFSAYPQSGLHVRSNSRKAFLKILGLIKGQSDNELTSLGKTEEFQYIRTLMPFEAPQEDGLIYLSDPFIRRLVGPEVKLTELRRLKCYNNLRMTGHAAAMFQAEHGHSPKSMAELRAAECLPNGFNKGSLKCQCGGEYRLSKDGRHGVCSHHGHADLLVPCSEIEATEVTHSEAKAYQQFVTEYSQYWRTFFDPIAIRVQSDADRYRLETIVLPLINNSMYQSLAATLGGEPKPLSTNVTDNAAMSLSFAIAKERLLRQAGWQPPKDLQAKAPPKPLRGAGQMASKNNLKQIGLALHNYHDAYLKLPAAFTKDANGKPLLSWRVSILPYIDHSRLYEEFHLNEPWDSPHNKALIPRIPLSFKSPGAKSLKPGMTTYQTVAGDKTIFPADGGKVRLRDITDGLSNTAFAFDASPEFATIWTKPGDLKLKPATVKKALHDRFKNGGLILRADGSCGQLRTDVDNATISNLFTRDDGMPIGDIFIPGAGSRSRGGSNSLFGLTQLVGGNVSERDVMELLARGLGNEVGLHVCDTDPMFDVQLTEILAELFGNSNRSNRIMGVESLWIGMAIASLTSPVYLNVSVDDVQVVDRFLQTLDEVAALEARKETNFGFFSTGKDFYKIPIGATTARSFVLRLGPVRWRLFYARIGSNLCIASKLETLEQLVTMNADKRGQKNGQKPRVNVTAGHALLTFHRRQWKRILPSLRLSWDESARNVCLNNIGPLTSASRVATAAMADDKGRQVTPKQLAKTAAGIYGGIHFCPCGGHYMKTKDGRIVCSVHGDAVHPRQPAVNAPNGASLKMLNSFSEIRVALTFLEDGLHAVLEIDRTAK